jgi:hypothetical protein
MHVQGRPLLGSFVVTQPPGSGLLPLATASPSPSCHLPLQYHAAFTAITATAPNPPALRLVLFVFGVFAAAVARGGGGGMAAGQLTT